MDFRSRPNEFDDHRSQRTRARRRVPPCVSCPDVTRVCGDETRPTGARRSALSHPLVNTGVGDICTYIHESSYSGYRRAQAQEKAAKAASAGGTNSSSSSSSSSSQGSSSTSRKRKPASPKHTPPGSAKSSSSTKPAKKQGQ